MSPSSLKSRLIIDAPMMGAANMSIDQALLESTAISGQTTLRFYRWNPATLSLGYFQKAADRDQHSASLSCAMVRRASGGGAIVHDDELTYSLCIATDGKIAKANPDLYDTVHHAIRESLEGQGIGVSLFEAPEGENIKASKSDPFLCFQRRAVGDLICEGHKIGGSAQRRLKNALIQHGSLLLSQSVFSPELPGLKELSGVAVDVDQLTAAISQRLAESLGIDIVPGEATENERSRAAEIEAEKFGSEPWSHKR